MRKLLWLALTASYPLLVYLGLAVAEPRVMALLLLGLGLARFITVGRSGQALFLAFAGLLLAAFTAFSNSSLPLKLYPVAVSAALLALFAFSLWRGPTVIERIARLQEPELDVDGVAYTRVVTQIWCGFFVFNGGIALGTALWASESVWALYNGLISYLLVALLLGAEWLVRRRWRAQKKAHHVA